MENKHTHTNKQPVSQCFKTQNFKILFYFIFACDTPEDICWVSEGKNQK